MTIKDFRKHFFDSLSGDFPAEEIGSFFNILTQRFLGLSRLEIALHPERDLKSHEQENFEDALKRLQQHEPIQYITGKTEFFGLQFHVNRNVLIPRAETEELVQWILDDHQDKNSHLKILDIGTGSGCIAISLAKKLPQAQVWAMDVSEAALEVAKSNAKLNQVKIGFLKENVLDLQTLNEQYDIIVSNPPYVRELEKKEMHKNVLEHEPELALYVKDDDPLLFYRKISALAEKGLTEGGKLYFEINQYLGSETEELLQEKNFRTTLKKDIFGVHRMLKGEKTL